MLVVDDAGLGREKEGGANFSCPPVDSRQIWDQWDSCGNRENVLPSFCLKNRLRKNQ